MTGDMISDLIARLAPYGMIFTGVLVALMSLKDVCIDGDLGHGIRGFILSGMCYLLAGLFDWSEREMEKNL